MNLRRTTRHTVRRTAAAVCVALLVGTAACGQDDDRGAPFDGAAPDGAAPGLAGESTASLDDLAGGDTLERPVPGARPDVTIPDGDGPLTGDPGPLQAPELPDARPLPTPNVPTTATPGPMPTVPGRDEGQRVPARVLRVIDGDTFLITGAGFGETRLRVIGYDTPEVHSGPAQCYGEEATKLATKLVGGKPILLEADPSQPGTDTHGRLLAHVYTNDNQLLGEAMIRAGAAVEMTVGQPHRHQGRYRAAEAAARAERVGQWGAC